MSNPYSYQKAGTKRKSGPSSYTKPVPVTYKRRKIVRAAPRLYVNRTPGGQITADNHYFDSELALTAIASQTSNWQGTEYDPATANCLFFPSQGDDISNRQGRKVFVKKMRIRAAISCAAQSAIAAADQEAVIRIIVYKDMQTNASQSQGENVISSGTSGEALQMFSNVGNLGRFQILYDKVHKISNRTMTDALQSGAYINFKINLKPNCWVNYNSTNGGTVADVVDNSFHIIANTSSASMVPQLQYKCRTVFTA